MNSTSPPSRLVRTAARSPGRSRAGPEVARKAEPISLATMPASDVLPSPGGPENSTWSTGSPRPRAASMRIASRSLRLSWPMKSSMRRGRSPASMTSSSGRGSPVSRPSSRIRIASLTFAAAELLKRHAQHVGHGEIRWDVAERSHESRPPGSRGLPERRAPRRRRCRRSATRRREGRAWAAARASASAPTASRCREPS